MESIFSHIKHRRNAYHLLMPQGSKVEELNVQKLPWPWSEHYMKKPNIWINIKKAKGV